MISIREFNDNKMVMNVTLRANRVGRGRRGRVVVIFVTALVEASSISSFFSNSQQ
ncbi:hypothetical protein KIN20_019638 [Parelaphostrongylus tenuis]|uniref:Uncharacterized protein n=1 Tax=Parelaphostrongylus tenuis TaxID=148309 RepID=A0AAD5QSK4_PARTN|nr:hypothetical protein KIN20_019638 [Parelaphostrongylus tenuis]